jgi:Uma2 family endonuclease
LATHAYGTNYKQNREQRQPPSYTYLSIVFHGIPGYTLGMSTATIGPVSPLFSHVPQRKRWSVPEFHRLCDEPEYENTRLMLIEGEILEMPNRNPPHSASLGLTLEALRSVFGSGFWLRPQMPLVLGLSTDPMPDVPVVSGSPRDFSTTQPRTAALVVEISDASLSFDTREKANLYAAGGIPEHWVVDLVNRQLHIFRDPTIDGSQAFAAYYRTRQSLDQTQQSRRLA